MTDDCLFCNIVNKKVDSLILYEDDIAMIFMDAFPNCDGHVLIIPKKHYDDFYDLDNETLTHMYDLARQFVKPIMQKLNKTSSTLLFNYGDSQVIKHVHLHILPNYGHEKAHMNREDVYKILMEK